MKITHNKVGQNVNTKDAKSEKASSAAKADATKKNSKTSESAAADVARSGSQATKVELSPRVQDIKKIKEAAKNAPDVNADKVAKFKQMIAEGKYKVDAKAVAEKMVDEAMMTAKSET
ncbi:MAG: flagellar biosynthesis anti-sigma factor FlgM [Bdellovibrionota bacterium]